METKSEPVEAIAFDYLAFIKEKNLIAEVVKQREANDEASRMMFSTGADNIATFEPISTVAYTEALFQMCEDKTEIDIDKLRSEIVLEMLREILRLRSATEPLLDQMHDMGDIDNAWGTVYDEYVEIKVRYLLLHQIVSEAKTRAPFTPAESAAKVAGVKS